MINEEDIEHNLKFILELQAVSGDGQSYKTDFHVQFHNTQDFGQTISYSIDDQKQVYHLPLAFFKQISQFLIQKGYLQIQMPGYVKAQKSSGNSRKMSSLGGGRRASKAVDLGLPPPGSQPQSSIMPPPSYQNQIPPPPMSQTPAGITPMSGPPAINAFNINGYNFQNQSQYASQAQSVLAQSAILSPLPVFNGHQPIPVQPLQNPAYQQPVYQQQQLSQSIVNPYAQVPQNLSPPQPIQYAPQPVVQQAPMQPPQQPVVQQPMPSSIVLGAGGGQMKARRQRALQAASKGLAKSVRKLD